MYYNHHDSNVFWDERHSAYGCGYEADSFDEADYASHGIDASLRAAWLEVSCPAFQAGWFTELGLTPQEVGTLRTHPEEARAFVRRAGFTVAQASAWIQEGFSAEEADIWSRAGWQPGEALALRHAYSEAAGAAIVWAFTGLSPVEAIERAIACESPLPFLPLPDCDPPVIEATVARS